jgi:hypothetical protein
MRPWRLKNVVWEAVTGKSVPDGWSLDCVDGDKTNIAFDNLELVTIHEARRRGERRNNVLRRQLGVKHRRAKFTEAQVRKIRASTETHTQLAARYNASAKTIWSIRTGRTYRNVDG